MLDLSPPTYYMYLQYSNRGVLFIMIYVDEAHPIEQNDFPPETGSLQMHLPQTIEQRMENASVLAEMTSVPVYVDTIDNIGESQYGAHPERLGGWLIINDSTACLPMAKFTN